MSLPADSKDRKRIPLTTGVLDYFPDAVAEIARVSFIGNEQHNPGEPLHWAREKSTDHADCISRHLLERGTLDKDGMRHSAKMAWRALALLQVEIERAVVSVPLPKEGSGLRNVSFDLDGTLAEPTWPSPQIGEPIKAGVDLLLAYRYDLNYEVIVFTSRPASHREAIRAWLDKHIPGVVYDIVTDKPRAAAYVDDRAITFPEAIEKVADGSR